MEVIYWLAAMVSSFILLFRVMLSVLGVDLDHDLIGFESLNNRFSFSALLAFFCIFGWTGVLGSRITDLSSLITFGVAIGAGGFGYTVSQWMFQKLKSIETSGNVDAKKAIGQVGTVYLGIPANRKGKGQIQLVLHNKMLIMDAETEGERINTGQKVLIYNIDGNSLLVALYDG